MEKVRVRYVVKSGKTDPGIEFDHNYDLDPLKRENISLMLEKQLDISLNELERNLKKINQNILA
jgi:hypothetical protein